MILFLKINEENKTFKKLKKNDIFTYDHHNFLFNDVFKLAKEYGIDIIYNGPSTEEYRKYGSYSCKVVDILDECPYCLKKHIKEQFWDMKDKCITPKQFCITSKILAKEDFINIMNEAIEYQLTEADKQIYNYYNFDIKKVLENLNIGLSDIYNKYSYRLENGHVELLFYHNNFEPNLFKDNNHLEYKIINQNQTYIKLNYSINQEITTNVIEVLKTHQIDLNTFYESKVKL